MIKLKTGLYSHGDPPSEYTLDRLGNEKETSLLGAIETFEMECEGFHGGRPYRVASYGWDGLQLGPTVEHLYQAFRVRLLYELKDHIPGLVEIVEEGVDDDSED